MRLKKPLSLLLFSIDGFHVHDDEIGDKLLKDFGELMRKLIRRADLPFRYGRNNFAVILPGCSGRIAEKVATRLSERGPSTHLSIPSGCPSVKQPLAAGWPFTKATLKTQWQ